MPSLQPSMSKLPMAILEVRICLVSHIMEVCCDTEGGVKCVQSME